MHDLVLQILNLSYSIILLFLKLKVCRIPSKLDDQQFIFIFHCMQPNRCSFLHNFFPISWACFGKLLLLVVFVTYVKAKVIKFCWLLSALTMYICMWLMAWSFFIKYSIFFPTSCSSFALDYPPIANWWHWSNQWTPSTFYFPSLWFQPYTYEQKNMTSSPNASSWSIIYMFVMMSFFLFSCCQWML
jgi:hypothetical protein